MNASAYASQDSTDQEEKGDPRGRTRHEEGDLGIMTDEENEEMTAAEISSLNARP